MKPLSLRDWIGASMIFAFIAAMGALLFKNIPQANEQIIVYMVGQLSGFVGSVVSYHYVMTSRTNGEVPKVQIDQPADKPVPVDSETRL